MFVVYNYIEHVAWTGPKTYVTLASSVSVLPGQKISIRIITSIKDKITGTGNEQPGTGTFFIGQ